MAVVLGNLGDLLHEMGDDLAAEPHLHTAIAQADDLYPAAAGAFRGTLALVAGDRGAFDEARALLEEGEANIGDRNNIELVKLLCKRVRIEHLAGDAQAAATVLDRAERIAREMGVGPESELLRKIREAHELLQEA